MIRQGDIVADRFEVVAAPKWGRASGVDRENGARVVFPEPWSFYFLDVVAMRAQAKIVRELDLRNVTRVISVDPVVLEAPGRAAEELTQGEIIDGALDLLDGMSRLMHAGVAVDPTTAVMVRAADGPRVRLLAPSAGVDLHVRHLPRWGRPSPLHDLASWVKTQLETASSSTGPIGPPLKRALGSLAKKDDVESFVKAIARFASHPASARKRARSIADLPAPFRPVLELDRGIEEGEEVLRSTTERYRNLMPHMRWPLAAAYHHRACVARAQGELERAARDIGRAIELDPHPRYLTTAALFAEKDGDGRAAELHDRAVAAIQPPPEEHGGIMVLLDGHDPPERAAFDAARTLHARGVFLAKARRFEAAVADLEASIARLPTDAAERALRRVRRQLE